MNPNVIQRHSTINKKLLRFVNLLLGSRLPFAAPSALRYVDKLKAMSPSNGAIAAEQRFNLKAVQERRFASKGPAFEGPFSDLHRLDFYYSMALVFIT